MRKLIKSLLRFPAMKVCNFCGTGNKDSATKCSYCGEDI